MNDPEDKSIPVNLEVLKPDVVGAIQRAQIDSQVATAHAYPRSIALFQKKAMEYVTQDEETAESCLYSRPVGKKKNEATGVWENAYAEGNSVRMAELVCSCFGNIFVEAYIVEQTERQVKCVGMARDLEANYAAKSEVVESTVTKTGEPFSERMRIVVAKACLSKARRDAVFQVVPKALFKRVSDAAKKIVTGDETTLDNRRKRIAEWLKSIAIDDERLFASLNVKGWSEIGIDQINTLTGLKTALKEGDTTKDEAFPPILKKGTIGKQDDQVPGAEMPPAGATTPAGQSPAELFPQPYAEIERRCGPDGVTLQQVFLYCKDRKLTGVKTEELMQVSEDKLRDLLIAWKNILPNIRKIEIK